MDIFGMGPLEILLILVVALIVFGPGKLPEIASGLGKAVREFRRMSSELTRDLTREISKEIQPGAKDNEETNSNPETTKSEEGN